MLLFQKKAQITNKKNFLNSVMDYTIFYKEQIADNDLANHSKWDLYISAYNQNNRIRQIFSLSNAIEKHWLIFPEFDFNPSEYPQLAANEKIFNEPVSISTDSVKSYLKKVDITKYSNICIDITGFTRASLIYFIRMLSSLNLKKMDIIYSEPTEYKDREFTVFSNLPKYAEPIPGCSEINPLSSKKDLLIVASGYDHQLIIKVASYKKSWSTKYQIFGLPSLQPDMYQENRFKAYQANSTMGDDTFNRFAPANDPFVTAQTIQNIVSKHLDYSNLYLSPLSTKAQTLGFILYYLYEGIGKHVSIIFPSSEKYSKQTSVGASKTWKYTIELP